MLNNIPKNYIIREPKKRLNKKIFSVSINYRYILPVMNPDGYEYSHTKDRMWRKNRAWHGGQCVGVDLNRNFRYA